MLFRDMTDEDFLSFLTTLVAWRLYERYLRLWHYNAPTPGKSL